MGGSLIVEIVRIAHSLLFELYSALGQAFMPLYVSILTFAIIVYGVGYMYGRIPPIISSVGAIVIISITVAFSQDAAMFKEWFFSPLFKTSFNLCSFALSSGHASSTSLIGVFSILDNGFFDMVDKFNQRINTLSIMDADFFPTYIVMGTMMLLYGVLYLIYLAVLTMGFVGLHIMAAPAPIMILLASFRQTRPYFYSWLRALATFAIMPFFASVALRIAISSIDQATAGITAIGPNDSIFNINTGVAALLFPLTTLFIFKASEFASFVTGGVASSVGGYFGTTQSSLVAAMGVGAAAKTRFGDYIGRAQAGMRAWRGAGDAGQTGVPRAWSAMLGLVNKQ